jgi:hypothetical protein
MERAIDNRDWADKNMRKITRVTALIWAVSWIIFGMIFGIEKELRPASVVGYSAIPGIIFLFTIIVAWRREAVGGPMLLIEGLIATVYFVIYAGHSSLLELAFMIVSITLPAFVMGTLFIVCWRNSKKFEEDAEATGQAS